MAKKVRGHRANKPNDSFGTVNNESLYKGKYREEVYQDDEEQDETEQDQELAASEEEATEEQATPQENFADPQPSNEPDYKKRYDDLKRHYDEKLAEWRDEKADLEAKFTSIQPLPSGSANLDLEQFQSQYPDVYAAIQRISSTQSEARVRNLEGELEEIKKREKGLEKQKAYEQLLRLQPDFDTLKESEDFTSWLKEQPDSISDGVYNNATDAQWASRVVDLYKSDKGLTKKSSTRTRKKSDAAMSVSKTAAREVSTESGEKRTWKASEIGRMKPWEFEKLEQELDAARQEGRIDYNN
jgi:anion-transporting  ArsA/GET3 family ATPase